MGSVLDVLLGYVSKPPATSVAKNAALFMQDVTASDLLPIGSKSAFPGLAVQEINTLLAGATAAKTRYGQGLAAQFGCGSDSSLS